MLDKLGLNKAIQLLIILCFLVISSCSQRLVNTQITCPDGSDILVNSATESDLRQAIKAAYDNKKRYQTSESYTPLRLRDGRSLSIARIPPEEMIRCNLREVPVGAMEMRYIISK